MDRFHHPLAPIHRFEFGVLDGTHIKSLAELVNKHVPIRF